VTTFSLKKRGWGAGEAGEAGGAGEAGEVEGKKEYIDRFPNNEQQTTNNKQQ